MFRRVKYDKLKTNLRLSIERMKRVKESETQLSLQSRGKIALLAKDGKHDQARIQVRQLIFHDYQVEVLEIVETLCSLLLVRFQHIERFHRLDDALLDAVVSVIWATPHLQVDVPELKVITQQVTAKYGKTFAEEARNNSHGMVNEKLVCRVAALVPPDILVEKYLTEISNCYTRSEHHTLSKPRETLKCVDKVETKADKIAYVNVRSLLAHFEEVKNFLKNSDVNVLGLGETWLDSTIDDNRVAINGFRLFRCDQSRHCGGVAVYVKESICCTPLECLQSGRYGDFWLLLKDTTLDTQPKVVGFLYQPPRSDSLDFCASLASSWDLITQLKFDAVVLGDFNVDYSPNASSAAGKRLQKLADMFNFVQIIKDPTRIARQSATIIDLIFTNRLTCCKSSGVLNISGLADHGVIYVVMS